MYLTSHFANKPWTFRLNRETSWLVIPYSNPVMCTLLHLHGINCSYSWSDPRVMQPWALSVRKKAQEQAHSWLGLAHSWSNELACHHQLALVFGWTSHQIMLVKDRIVILPALSHSRKRNNLESLAKTHLQNTRWQIISMSSWNHNSISLNILRVLSFHKDQMIT